VLINQDIVSDVSGGWTQVDLGAALQPLPGAPELGRLAVDGAGHEYVYITGFDDTFIADNTSGSWKRTQESVSAASFRTFLDTDAKGDVHAMGYQAGPAGTGGDVIDQDLTAATALRVAGHSDVPVTYGDDGRLDANANPVLLMESLNGYKLFTIVAGAASSQPLPLPGAGQPQQLIVDAAGALHEAMFFGFDTGTQQIGILDACQ
jgi:hypothetical protein